MEQLSPSLPRADSLPAASQPQRSRGNGPHICPRDNEPLAFLDLQTTCRLSACLAGEGLLADPVATGSDETTVVSTSMGKPREPAKAQPASSSSTDSRRDAPAAVACGGPAERSGRKLEVVIPVGTVAAAVFPTSPLPSPARPLSPEASATPAVGTCGTNTARRSVSRPRRGRFAGQELGNGRSSATVHQSACCTASIPESPAVALPIRRSTSRPRHGRYTQLPGQQAMPGSPLYHPLPIPGVLLLAAGNHWVDPNDLSMDLSKTLRHRQMRRTGQIGSKDPIPECKKEQRALRRLRLKDLAGRTCPLTSRAVAS